MAPRYDVREVLDLGRHWQVVYDVTNDDGSTAEHGHSIPKETLEWRAAEYDLDPTTQFETILDIVLAEPYVTEEDQGGGPPGEELYDAPDIATARAWHINRCARAKLKHRISTRKVANGNGKAAKAAIPNAFDVIRADAVIDPVVVAVKKEHVRRVREDRARPVRESSPERAARIAEELGIDLKSVMRGMKNG